MLPVPVWVVSVAVGVAAGEDIPPTLGIGIVVMFCLVTFVPMGVLMWDALHSPRVPERERTMWFLVLLFLAVFAMPFYYSRYRRPRREGRERCDGS